MLSTGLIELWLLDLVIALVPEAASVLWWLYERETLLVTHRSDKVTCSTGVMQGCPFASIAFALLVKWLVAQMTHSGLNKNQFFMDDGLRYGEPEAIKWCLDLIEKHGLLTAALFLSPYVSYLRPHPILYLSMKHRLNRLYFVSFPTSLGFDLFPSTSTPSLTPTELTELTDLTDFLQTPLPL